MDQINIKNQETVRLAHELAAMTNESITTAVTRALQDKIDKVHEKQSNKKEHFLEEIQELVDKISQAPDRDTRHPDDILYDENGLPK